MVRGAFGSAQAAAASGEFAGCIGGGRFAGSAGVGELSSLAEILESLQFTGASSTDKGSRFQHQTDFAQEQPVMAVTVNLAPTDDADAEATDPAVVVDPEEEARKKREAELESLQQQLAEIMAQFESHGKEQGALTSNIRQNEAALGQALSETDKLEKAYMVKKKSIEMLPDAANNLVKLQGICGKTAQRLMTLATEWEAHRKPLIDAQRTLKEGLSLRKERCKKMVTEMKNRRGEMQKMGATIREREERYRALSEEYEKMPKNVNRGLYTYRIMDIIKQVRKQKEEIAKIIGDIHNVQKDINMASDKLKRTEAVADERIYQAASEQASDAAHVQAYSHLSDLRECFEQLINTVSDRGRAENAARDLEARSEQLASRNTSNNMERILSDLQQVKAENQAMMARLR